MAKQKKSKPKKSGPLTEEEMYDLERSINKEMEIFVIENERKKTNSWLKAMVHLVG